MSTQRYGTARTYAFIGFIFYVITAALAILGLLITGIIFAAAVSTVTFPDPITPPASVSTVPFFVILTVFLILFIPAIILAFFAWSTVKAIDSGKYGQARTNSLILGIIGLFFGIFIGGIFFLLAYANLGEIPQPYITPQPQPQRFCVHCGKPISHNDRYCSYCGKEQPT
ncbi:MAG TPA: zinc ribbon domain-containing protein [Candidatus Bathyarchaeia archaeon]|nr:zinc ribbon domain-containing protein [Candidatus Bathyarchaeia archaeon]